MTVKPPREDMDPVAAFVALEKYNAIQLMHAVDADFQHLAKSASDAASSNITLGAGCSRARRCSLQACQVLPCGSWCARHQTAG